MSHEYEMCSVRSVVNIYAIPLYLDIMMIILKLTEILNPYVLYEELIQSCRSIMLQKQTNKTIGKEITLVVIRGWRKQGELDEGSQIGRKAMTNLNSVLKRHHFAAKVRMVKALVFFSSHVRM